MSTLFKMFLRRIVQLNFSGLRLNRWISQSTKTAVQSNELTSRSLKTSNESPSNPSAVADVSSAMKLSVFKRLPRKKTMWQSTTTTNQQDQTTYFDVSAYATADWYDLDRLKQRFLKASNAFQIVSIPETFNDVLCVQISKATSSAPVNSQAFIFDDGAVVFWNVEHDDETLIFQEVNQVSDNQYPTSLVNNEKEMMKFVPVTSMSSLNNDTIKLNCQSESEQLLDKYTFSNALALSVKLGIWEALLDDEVEFVADLANRLKQGQHIKIEHGLMQRKSGELYSLKHAVNLSHG